jgi:hypothetical protein
MTATIAAAAASLCLACHGGPIDRPIAFRNALRSSRPSAAAASREGGARERLAVHDRVGDGLRTIVGDALCGRRRKFRAAANGDVRNRHSDRCSQRLETCARTARGGLAHAFDECQGVSKCNRPCPWAIEVTTHRPRALVMMGVGRQTGLGQVVASTIEELASGRDGDEHRRVAVLGDPDGRSKRGRICDPSAAFRQYRRSRLYLAAAGAVAGGLR